MRRWKFYNKQEHGFEETENKENCFDSVSAFCVLMLFKLEHDSRFFRFFRFVLALLSISRHWLWACCFFSVVSRAQITNITMDSFYEKHQSRSSSAQQRYEKKKCETKSVEKARSILCEAAKKKKVEEITTKVFILIQICRRWRGLIALWRTCLLKNIFVELWFLFKVSLLVPKGSASFHAASEKPQEKTNEPL